VLLYTTARHSAPALTVLTASAPPNCAHSTGLFFIHRQQGRHRLVCALECLGGFSPPSKKATDAAAVHGTHVSVPALGTNVYTFLRRAILSSWQAEWHSDLGSKLRLLKPSVQEWQSSFRAVRKDEVTLARLWVGHTRLKHGPLSRGQPSRCPSWCTALVMPKPAVPVTLTA
jgi:hypothetical protein